MVITSVDKFEDGTQVIIRMDVQQTYPPMTVLPITARWNAAANQLKKEVDIPTNQSIIEVRAGVRFGFNQEFQLSYKEQDDATHCE